MVELTTTEKGDTIMVYQFRDGTVLEIVYDGEIRIDEWKEDGGEGSGNFGHSGRQGKRGGSGKGLNLNNYKLIMLKMKKANRVKGNSPCGKNKVPKRWSATEMKEQTHIKHAIEYGISYEEYTQKAVDLINSPVDHKNILGYCRYDGTIVRYNVKTRDIALGDVRKGIITAFQVNEYKADVYFLNRMDKDADKGGYTSD